MTIGYQEDLALIHHLGFSTPSPPRARARRALLRRRLAPGSLVVDLGCGSGVWAAELTEAGYRVFGVDQSPAMVALAKKSAKGSRRHFPRQGPCSAGLAFRALHCTRNPWSTGILCPHTLKL